MTWMVRREQRQGGKGVIVCETRAEVDEAIRQALDTFGAVKVTIERSDA